MDEIYRTLKDGRVVYQRYALYNYYVDDLKEEIDDAAFKAASNNPYEIVEKIKEWDCDDFAWSVAIFWADDEDRWVDGEVYYCEPISEFCNRYQYKEQNGELIYKRYALYNFCIDDMEEKIQSAVPEMVTSDPYEITMQVGGCEDHALHWCVKTFWVDDTDECAFGSDIKFENVVQFYEQYPIKG